MPRGLQTVRRILVLIHKYSTSDELYGMSVLGGGVNYVFGYLLVQQQ